MPRARDLGIEIGRLPPGPRTRSPTSTASRVGHTTLIEGDDVRTGVTVVVPPPEPLFAGCAPDQRQRRADRARVDPRLRAADDADRAHEHALGRRRPRRAGRRRGAGGGRTSWSLPVVGETWDGVLNDINGFHVRPEHVRRRARGGLGGRGRGGLRRRRHRDGLPRLQGRDRHGVARRRGRLDRSACSCRRTTAGARGCA